MIDRQTAHTCTGYQHGMVVSIRTEQTSLKWAMLKMSPSQIDSLYPFDGSCQFAVSSVCV